jgi:hypothetical protein
MRFKRFFENNQKLGKNDENLHILRGFRFFYEKT